MEILKELNALLVSWGMRPALADALDQVIAFVAIIAVAYLADMICRVVLLKAVAKLVKKTKVVWDDIVFHPRVMSRLSRVVAPAIIFILIPLAFPDSGSFVLTLIQRVCLLYIILAVLYFINALLKAIYSVYSDISSYRDRPLKGLLQTAQIIVWFVGAIILVSVLIDRSPITLLAGLGASAAVLMLIFKDSIVGLVSGIQLSANDMLKVGDWIAIPDQGVNGSVTEVSLVSVKVRNWDNSIVTIPPYSLLSGSFQNWRNMLEGEGRRIARSINIDMNTVRFCTPEMVDRLRQCELLADYLEEMGINSQSEDDRATALDEGQSGGQAKAVAAPQTNLGLLRLYLIAYLRHLPEVNTDLTYTVRQLQPTEHGIPLEVYFFSRIKDWVPYERIQADLFSHILAIVPEFGLRVYQLPAGTDVQALQPSAGQ